MGLGWGNLPDVSELLVGAGSRFRVDFLRPESVGEAGYWVLNTREGGPVSAEPAWVARPLQAAGMRREQAGALQAAPDLPPQGQSAVLALPVSSSPIETAAILGTAALGGAAFAKWLGASWLVIGGSAVAAPVAIWFLAAAIIKMRS